MHGNRLRAGALRLRTGEPLCGAAAAQGHGGDADTAEGHRYLEATGYASAINTTNLVARVQGFLQKINYKDGDQVKEGATLFVIEPEPYKTMGVG